MFFYRLLLFFQQFLYVRLHNETIESSSQDEKKLLIQPVVFHVFVLSIQKVFGKARIKLISPYVRSEYESDHALSLLFSIRDTTSFLHVELS